MADNESESSARDKRRPRTPPILDDDDSQSSKDNINATTTSNNNNENDNRKSSNTNSIADDDATSEQRRSLFAEQSTAAGNKNAGLQGPHSHVPRELIKPDPTVRKSRVVHVSPRRSPRSPRSSIADSRAGKSSTGRKWSSSSSRIATAVDDEQLHRRLVASISARRSASPQSASKQQQPTSSRSSSRNRRQHHKQQQQQNDSSAPLTDQSLHCWLSDWSDISDSSTGQTTSAANASSLAGPHKDDDDDENESPPPAAIIIPSSVARELSQRSVSDTLPASGKSSDEKPAMKSLSRSSASQQQQSPTSPLSREQLEYGPLLEPGEVQVLYRSPENRQLKDEHAKLVAPDKRQSPISILSPNSAYTILNNRPLVFEYPTKIENLRLTNTGYSWQVKIPYQVSMVTALHGGTLPLTSRFRLDQFHCHWGQSDDIGSEHTVNNKHYAAEVHFVHYNMEKYHTMSMAARHPDGLVVLAVFLEVKEEYQNHAELEKITSYLKNVPLKGEHALIKQPLRIDNLFPANKSYWTYSGSLTTLPYYESVQWFVLKTPIKCSKLQIERFRQIKSTVRHQHGHQITSNHRKTQPLNGRTVATYDE